MTCPVFPKAVACDLDGTLLCSDGTLDRRTTDVLAEIERAGILLVLCTARPPRWIRPLADSTGHRGTAICANGALICELPSGSVLESRPLAPEAAQDVVTLLQAALPGGAWAVERLDGFAHEPSYRPHWPVPEGTVVEAVESLIAEPAIKLMLRHEQLEADALLALAKEVVGHRAELTHSSSAGSLLEISAHGVSKASALARLCAQRGIAAAEVIAFGDMPNDLPMLEWAGHAVAVANAHPEVLAAAGEITTGNDDAGVARVLERLLQPSAAATRCSPSSPPPERPAG